MPDGFIKTSVSFDPELLEKAKTLAARKGFGTSFSAYLATLLRKDLAEDQVGASLTMREAVAGPKPLPPPKRPVTYRKPARKQKGGPGQSN